MHTVALPDPGEVFTDAALVAVEQVLNQAATEDVADLVERRQLAVVQYWASRPVDTETEAPFVDLPAPAGLVDRVVARLGELETALTHVDPRWGLEIALALDDLVDAG